MTQERHLSLRELSRGFPDQSERHSMVEELTGASDRTAAIVLSSLVEYSVHYSVRSRLIDDERIDAFFYGATAPFQTFSSRIKLGVALGIYGPQTEKALNIVREVRNVFAHALKKVDFETHAIRDKCLHLEWSVDWGKAGDGERFSPARRKFSAVCLNLGMGLALEAEKFKRQIGTALP